MLEYDLSGKLRCFTLSDVIQLLSFSGQTGTLTLSQGWNSRTITFENGRITYIASAVKLSTTEELLLKAGRIDKTQLTRAITEAAPDGHPVDAMLAAGLVDQQDVQRCMEQQLEENIYSLFLWRNCRFSFESAVLAKQGGIPVDIAGERLIMEGTRRVDEWIAISPVIPSVRLIFRTLGNERLAERTCEEQIVYRQIDGIRDVSAIAQAAGMTQFDTAKCLYDLVRCGLVSALPPDKANIIELFKFLVESTYLKLMMFGYSPEAFEFQNQLNRFSHEHNLKTRMVNGKIRLSDLHVQVETTALIDLYKLFMAIENNKFGKLFPQDIVYGLVEGLYLHVDSRYQDMMRMYDFYPIEGLLMSRAPHYQTPRPVGARA